MIPAVVFRKRCLFTLFLVHTSNMRAILFIFIFSFPMLSSGQASRCLVDGKIDALQDTSQYKLFQTVYQYKLKEHKIRNRTVQYFPIVIHVVSREHSNPVSEAQVRNQLDVLNADFSGRGDNIPKLLPEFASMVADADVRFCLATHDPDGNPSTGITFTQTDISNIALQTGPQGRIAIHYDQLGGKTGWNPSKYINVWIGEYGDILGSATFPGAAPFSEEIGVVIDPKYFGSIGPAGNSGFFSWGHTLTHEVGHFFGLQHIWGNGFNADCADSDDISDTPNAEGPYFGCPQGVQVSCNTSDMYQNFMDLTDDRCLAAFTIGQVAFMQSAIDVYYPDLTVEGECTTYTNAFDTWYAELVWSHDASSDTYVVYSAEILDSQKKVEVFGVDGRLVYHQQWGGQQTHLLNLRSLASGIYFVRITQGEKYSVRTIVLY